MGALGVDYDYGPVPTIRDFARSNAEIRGLMGPFGCLSGSSEYLSPAGWRRMDEYDGGQVAVWSDGLVEWEVPAVYIEQPCTNLIRFDSGSLVMELSDEHRVPHWDWKGEFAVKTAAEIAEHPSRRTIPTTFVLARKDSALSEDIIRFGVMFSADGHVPPQGKQVQVCLRKDRKKARLRALLQRLGIKWVERCYPTRPTETTFAFESAWANKSLDWVWHLSSAELEVVIDEAMHWDGLANHAEKRYFSTSRKNADAIQFAAHATGRRATISMIEYDNKNWRPGFSVYIRTGNNPKNVAAVREHTRITRFAAESKYCFTTSTGFFVARCEGTIFVTGNSGKSSGCVIEILRRSINQAPGPDGKRRSRWACIRNSYPQLRDTTTKTWLDWCADGVLGTWRANDHTYHLKFNDVEAEILFRALDRPDQVSNLLSLELSGAWVNEAREIDWSIIQALYGRTGRYPRMVDGGATWSGLILDTNPPSDDSWWYKLFEVDRPANAALFRQPSGLSPQAENLPNLKPGYYEGLTRVNSADWCRVHVHGEYGYVQDGKPVYPEFSDELHTTASAEYVKGWKIYRGWDFGLTPACVFTHLSPSGRWIVFDELVADNVGIDRFSDTVLRRMAERYPDAQCEDIGDPAGEQRSQTDEKTCYAILQAKGILISAGLQDLTMRVESVRKPLGMLADGKPAFALNPRCETLRRGFLGRYRYARMQTSQERYTDQPEKNAYSHCFVAGTMVATTAGEQPIERLRVGDKVMTPLGARRVTATMSSMVDDLVDLTFANGRGFRCTKDHPIYTRRGVVPADALQYDDVLLFIGEGQWLNQESGRFRNSTASSITASRRAITKATAAMASTCIAWFGRFITAPFLPVATYTIGTATVATTTSPTLSAWQQASTLASTRPRCCPRVQPLPRSTWTAFGPLPARGMGQSRGASGTASRARNLGATVRSCACRATSAARSLTSFLAARSADSARRLANPQRGGPVAWMTNSDPAPSAVRCSPSTVTAKPDPAAPSLVAKRYVSKQCVRVYDLTVEEAHCFYAAGVLVGNCHDALQYVATRLFGQGLRTGIQQPERRERYGRRYSESGSWLTM